MKFKETKKEKAKREKEEKRKEKEMKDIGQKNYVILLKTFLILMIKQFVLQKI